MIDWFTVAAQVVNFLILVFLLRRFLYKPILRTIEARKKNIAAQFEEAHALRTEGEQLRAAYEQKHTQFEDEREALRTQVKTEVSAEKESLLREARMQVEAARVEWTEELRRETRDAHTQIRRQARTEAFEIAKKVLQDMSAHEIGDGLIDRLVSHLSQATVAQREMLQEAYKETGRVVVASTFPVSETNLEALTTCLGDLLQTPENVRIAWSATHTDSGALPGILVTIGSQRINWSFERYLEKIEHGVDA